MESKLRIIRQMWQPAITFNKITCFQCINLVTCTCYHYLLEKRLKLFIPSLIVTELILSLCYYALNFSVFGDKYPLAYSTLIGYESFSERSHINIYCLHLLKPINKRCKSFIVLAVEIMHHKMAKQCPTKPVKISKKKHWKYTQYQSKKLTANLTRHLVVVSLGSGVK